jgi:hypothetical protein
MSMLGMLVPLSRISQEGTESESRKKKSPAWIRHAQFIDSSSLQQNLQDSTLWRGPIGCRRIRTASAAGCAAVQQRRPWEFPWGISTGDREMVYIEQKTNDILWNGK